MSDKVERWMKDAAKEIMERYHCSMYAMDIDSNARIIARHAPTASDAELRLVLSNARDSLVWNIAQRENVDSVLLAKRFAEYPESRPPIIEAIDAVLAARDASRGDATGES